jgi:hypothetical protein
LQQPLLAEELQASPVLISVLLDSVVVEMTVQIMHCKKDSQSLINALWQKI